MRHYEKNLDYVSLPFLEIMKPRFSFKRALIIVEAPTLGQRRLSSLQLYEGAAANQSWCQRLRKAQVYAMVDGILARTELVP